MNFSKTNAFRYFLGCLLIILLSALSARGQQEADSSFLSAIKQQYHAGNYEHVLSMADSLSAVAVSRNLPAWQSEVLNLKANTLRRIGEEISALEIHHQVLAIRRQLYGHHSLKVANSLHNIGNSWLSIDQPEQAATYLDEALKIREALLSPPHWAFIDLYSSLAVYHRLERRYDTAEALLMEAIQMEARLESKMDTLSFVNLRINLGNVLLDQQAYLKAKPVFEEAVELTEAGISSGKELLAMAYAGLGTCLHKAGRLAEALIHYRKAHSLYNTFQNNPVDVSNCLNMEGLCLLDCGDYEQAGILFQKALAVLLPRRELFSLRVANLYNNLALSHRYRKNIDQAIHFHELAINIYLREGAFDAIEVAGFYSNIGKCYWLRFSFAAAKYYFEKALEVQLADGRDAGAIVKSYVQLGNCRLQEGEVEQALVDYQTALDKLRCNNLQLQSDAHLVFLSIAQAHNRQQQPAQAILYLEKAIEVLKAGEAFAYQKAKVLTAWGKSLALMAAESGKAEDWKLALEHYLLALSTVQDIPQPEMEASASLYLKSDFFQLYEGLVSTAFQIGSRPYLEQAYEFAEQYKASLLRQSMQAEAVKQIIGVPDSLLQREKLLQQQIFHLNNRCQQEEAKGPLANTKRLTLWYKQQAKIKAEYQVLLKQLSGDFGAYYNAKFSSSVLSVDSMQNLLKPEQAMVTYFWGTQTALAFLIRTDTFIVVNLPLSLGLESKAIDWYYLLTTRPDMHKHPDEAHRQWVDLASKLYQAWIKPLEKHLPTHLIIVPDGLMCYLPFEALLKTKPEYPHLFNKHDYLCRHYEISYSYAASLYASIIAGTQESKAREPWLGVAPSFESGYRQLRPLTYNDDEILAINRKLKGEAWINEEALKGCFLKKASDYKVLHLATHSVLNRESPPYSYLAFTASAPDSLAVNILFLHELYGLRLDTELVVLSACQTGIGRYHRGEGVMSIARAFTFSGVRSVVASLWSIDDQQTHQLMTYFYDKMGEGHSKSKALQAARIGYLEAASAEQGHPYYWAAMILTGTPQPIELSKGYPLIFWLIPIALIILLLGWVFYRKQQLYTDGLSTL